MLLDCVNIKMACVYSTKSFLVKRSHVGQKIMIKIIWILLCRCEILCRIFLVQIQLMKFVLYRAN